MYIASSSLVKDSIERSLFGKFSENYKTYQQRNRNATNDMKIWREYFADSDILQDATLRILLYFNLPPEIVMSEVKPEKIFSQDLTQPTQNKEDDFIREMLNNFENRKSESTSKRLANVILLRVPNNQDHQGAKNAHRNYEEA